MLERLVTLAKKWLYICFVHFLWSSFALIILYHNFWFYPHIYHD
jgi:hypothetical protein